MSIPYEAFESVLGLPRRDPRVSAVVSKLRVTEEDEYEGYGSVAAPRDGVDIITKWARLIFHDGDETYVVSTIHFHAAGHEGYARYSGGLPRAVSFDDGMRAIEAKLGEPHASGEVERKTWVRYSIGQNFLHFEFDGDGRLVLVSLTMPENVPA